MKTRNIACGIVTLFCLCCLWEWNSYASMTTGIMRARSKAIERAVRKNIEIIIKPKLTVARGSTGPVSALALSPESLHKPICDQETQL